jgi:hypothetical protein
MNSIIISTKLSHVNFQPTICEMVFSTNLTQESSFFKLFIKKKLISIFQSIKIDIEHI